MNKLFNRPQSATTYDYNFSKIFVYNSMQGAKYVFWLYGQRFTPAINVHLHCSLLLFLNIESDSIHFQVDKGGGALENAFKNYYSETGVWCLCVFLRPTVKHKVWRLSQMVNTQSLTAIAILQNYRFSLLHGVGFNNKRT